jgi:PAS domain S-box-containing protein
MKMPSEEKNIGKISLEENLKEIVKTLSEAKGAGSSDFIRSSGNRDLDILIAYINSTLSTLEKLKEKRKKEIEDFQKKNEELEETKKALTNILEDVEDARSRSEDEKNRTMSIISNLSDGLMVFNQEKKLSLINPQAEIFFGRKSPEITGKSFAELAQFPTFMSLVNLLGEEIKGVFRKEISPSENLVLEISAIPIVEKEHTEFLIILHDITREKMIEKIKTEFVSISAHQLRTPLAAIKWTLRMILDGDVGKISEEQKELLNKTYMSNERMISLINDLLDVTRIEEGRYLYKPILTEIEPIIQFAVNSSKGEIDQKNLTIEFDRTVSKMPKVMVDVEKIKLAVQNFLENAIKYTPSGGRITISLKTDKKEIEFSIKDTGAGIPQDQKDRIFTKFFRGSNIIKISTEGTGLGLFITKNIIEAHGGRVWFESEEGKGAVFHFTLPIKEGFGEFVKEF